LAGLAMLVGSGEVSFTIWPKASPITSPKMITMGRSCHARPVIMRRPICGLFRSIDATNAPASATIKPVPLKVTSQCPDCPGEVFGTEAAEPYRRVGSPMLSRRFVGSFGASTRPPVNFNSHGCPKPEPLRASSTAAITGLLPGPNVSRPALIRDQTYSLVLDCREAVFTSTLSETCWETAYVSD
jgi:hypothetical protein